VIIRTDSSPDIVSPDHKIEKLPGRATQALLDFLQPAILMLVGFAPLLWNRADRPIIGIDSLFSLNPAAALGQALLPWSVAGSPGVANSQTPALPVYIFEWLLFKAGIPLGWSELLTVAIFASVAAFGVYRLTAMMIQSEGLFHGVLVSELAATAAGVLWVVNPASLAQVWYRQTYLEVTWALLPWLLLVVLRATRDENVKPSWIAAASGATALVGSAGLPEAYLPGIAVLLTMWCVPPAWVRWRAGDRQVPIRLAAAAAGLICGLAWWLLPALQFLRTLVSEAQLSPSTAAELNAFSPYLSLGRIVSLRDAPFLWQAVSVNGARFTPWASVITTGALSGLPLFVPLTALAGILLYPRKRQSGHGYVIGALLTVVAGAFLTKGANPPWSGLGLLLTRLPFGSAFRDPASTLLFVTALPLCVLFGIGVNALTRLSIGGRMLSLALVAGSLGPVLFVWFGGAVIPGRVGPIPSSYVTVPRSYVSSGKWINQEPAGTKVMVLPYSRFGQTAVRWRSGAETGPDCLLPSFAVKEIFICGNTGLKYADVPGQKLATEIAANPTAARALAWLWGVGVWIAHRDWNYQLAPDTYSGRIATKTVVREAYSGTTRDSFRSTHLVAIKQTTLPLIYAAKKWIPLQRSSLPISRVEEAFSEKTAAVVSSGRKPVSCSQRMVLRSDGSVVDPSGVVRGTGIACIVFGETYSPGWRLNASNGKVLRHFVANGWENCWLMRVRGVSRWQVTFVPGEAVSLGLTIGAVEWFVLLAGLAFLGIRRVRRRVRGRVAAHSRSFKQPWSARRT
jgi:hypothetical protein